MDTLGAIVGPTAAMALLVALKNNYALLFLLTLIPGLAATVVIAVLVRETDRLPVSHVSFAGRLATLPKRFRRFLVGVGLFGGGDFAHTMLILLAIEKLSPTLGKSKAAAVASYWEAFAAVCPNLIEALFAPIILTVDREKRYATIRIPGIAESDVEPIKNPATGEEHRARIALPNGFEYKEAEMGNTVSCRVSAGDKLTFELKGSREEGRFRLLL